MRRCSKCKVTIPEHRKDTYCGECRREYNRAWERKNKEKRKENRQTPKAAKKSRKKHRLKKYGISLEEWNLMRENQGYKCYICKTHESECQQNTLCVDHCHDSGNVRGLLCHSCNRGIGLLRDDISLLETAISYLKGE